MHEPVGARFRADRSRLGPKSLPVVDLVSGFGLPLMDHLVEQCVLHLRPRVPLQMSAAHRNLNHLVAVRMDRHLAESRAHPVGDAKPDLGQSAAEVSGIQFLVRLGETHQERPVSRGASPAGPRLAAAEIGVDGE